MAGPTTTKAGFIKPATLLVTTGGNNAYTHTATTTNGYKTATKANDPKDVKKWTEKINGMSVADWKFALEVTPKWQMQAFEMNRTKVNNGTMTPAEFKKIQGDIPHWWLLELVYDYPGTIKQEAILNFLLAFFGSKMHFPLQWKYGIGSGFSDSFWSRLFSDYLYLYFDHIKMDNTAETGIGIGDEHLREKLHKTGEYRMVAQASWDTALTALNKYTLYSLTDDSGISGQEAANLAGQIRESGRFIHAAILAQGDRRNAIMLEKKKAFDTAMTILGFIPYGVIFSAVGKFLSVKSVGRDVWNNMHKYTEHEQSFFKVMIPLKESKVLMTARNIYDEGSDFFKGFKEMEAIGKQLGISPMDVVKKMMPADLKTIVHTKLLNMSGMYETQRVNMESHTGKFVEAFHAGRPGEINEIFKNLVGGQFKPEYSDTSEGKTEDIVNILQNEMILNNFTGNK